MPLPQVVSPHLAWPPGNMSPAAGEGGCIRIFGKDTVVVAGELDVGAAPGAIPGRIRIESSDVAVLALPEPAAIAAQAATMTESVIDATTLSRALDTGDVTIIAHARPAETSGNIAVRAPVGWRADTALTLHAAGTVDFHNAVMAIGHAASVHIVTRPGIYPHFDGGHVSFYGTESALSINGKPYLLLHHPEDLRDIGARARKHFALAGSLDLRGVALHSIGPEFGARLKHFEGLGHRITAARIVEPNGRGVGLFSRLDNGATISNLNVHQAVVTGAGDVGTIAGEMRGQSRLIRVQVKDSVAMSISRAINEPQATGGLVGVLGDQAHIVASSVSGMRVEGYRDAGGIAGRMEGDAYAQQVKADGILRGGWNTGGMVGALTQRARIVDGHWNGNISSVLGESRHGAGGLVGRQSGGVVDGASASGRVAGIHCVGGAVGEMTGHATLRGVTVSNRVQGQERVGGLVGATRPGSNVIDNIMSGVVDGEWLVGALVGDLAGGVVLRSRVDAPRPGKEAPLVGRLGANHAARASPLRPGAAVEAVSREDQGDFSALDDAPPGPPRRSLTQSLLALLTEPRAHAVSALYSPRLVGVEARPAASAPETGTLSGLRAGMPDPTPSRETVSPSITHLRSIPVADRSRFMNTRIVPLPSAVSVVPATPAWYPAPTANGVPARRVAPGVVLASNIASIPDMTPMRSAALVPGAVTASAASVTDVTMALSAEVSPGSNEAMIADEMLALLPGAVPASSEAPVVERVSTLDAVPIPRAVSASNVAPEAHEVRARSTVPLPDADPASRAALNAGVAPTVIATPLAGVTCRPGAGAAAARERPVAPLPLRRSPPMKDGRTLPDIDAWRATASVRPLFAARVLPPIRHTEQWPGPAPLHPAAPAVARRTVDSPRTAQAPVRHGVTISRSAEAPVRRIVDTPRLGPTSARLAFDTPRPAAAPIRGRVDSTRSVETPMRNRVGTTWPAELPGRRVVDAPRSAELPVRHVIGASRSVELPMRRLIYPPIHTAPSSPPTVVLPPLRRSSGPLP
ncbi:MAG: hypothetical protein ACRYGL_14080 [Janthinobacterium lividum]